ncbi:rubrerythrin [Candidatus Poribacteria bacterium]|jgi:bacterioferritin|nr:rubrerythrin [Candidatus Poribacteria bacterium]MBT5536213.1 rubrerythrin [Candidatus Poribacteria bacterium]MBT5713062.1 rubrerythrin [Candidatus Poribacteria bacterium]MBT7101043.1 rubrerythrin [Candidatus Poribacteria bacterium]MBT7806290.1 rubrerythrin [Candidatus Poribacteria bacterium]
MADQALRDQIVEGLIEVYWMELEAALNFIACSINPDGVRAAEIKQSLAGDVVAEVGHAQAVAARIKELGGTVPGSQAFKATQTSLQPPEDSTDIVTVIRGVIDAETAVIEQYNHVIALCDGVDYVTQDLCIRCLADEETHKVEFQGFLKEYETRG